MRIEHPRAFQVEVHVDLPREAHAAEHLHRRLPVGDRGLARQRLGPGDPAVEAGLVRIVEVRARAYTAARATSVRTSMSAHRCLIAWNRRSAGRTARAPSRTRRRARCSGRRARVAAAVKAPRPRRATPERSASTSTPPPGVSTRAMGVSGSERPRSRRGDQRTRIDPSELVAPEHEEIVEHVDKADPHLWRRVRLPMSAIRPAPSSDDGTNGPGTQNRPSCSNTMVQSAHEKPSARNENTPASASSSNIAIEAGAHALDRDPRREHRDPVAQRDLVVGEVEIHQRGSLGRPSTRSPMMLRWICDAPAAIVSASTRSRSSTSSLPSMCSASRSSTRRHSSPKR